MKPPEPLGEGRRPGVLLRPGEPSGLARSGPAPGHDDRSEHRATRPTPPGVNGRAIPVDTVKVEDTPLTEADWAAAEGSHERFKRLLEEKPRAKARFTEVLAELNAAATTARGPGR